MASDGSATCNWQEDADVKPILQSETSQADDDSSDSSFKTGADAIEDSVNQALDSVKEIGNQQLAANGKRVMANFLTLAKNSWVDVAYSAGALLASTALWSIIFGVGGFLLGIAIYIGLLAFGWASWKWQYFWVIGWLIPVLFAASFTIGFGYAGSFYGARKFCYQAIDEDHLIERVSMTMYCAMIMEHAEYEATGEESVADLIQVVESAEDYQLEFDEEFRETLKSQVLSEEQEHGWMETQAVDFGVELIDGQIGKWVKENGVDLRVLVVAYMNRSEAESKFGAVNVQNVLAAAAPLFERGHEVAKAWLDTLFLPNIYIGCGLGALIPLGLLMVVHLIVFIVRWIYGSFNNPPPAEAIPVEIVKP